MQITLMGLYRLNLQLNTLIALTKLAKTHFCRLPVIISGSAPARNQLAEQFFTQHKHENTAWVSDCTSNTFESLIHLKANNVIGTEYQFIAYDIEGDFDPNLFAALSGALCGGGLFLILCPPLNSWKEELKVNNNWFMWRFVNKLSESRLSVYLNLEKSADSHIDIPILNELHEHNSFIGQQTQAIQKIIHVVKGHRNRPLVLLADRGRGKSAALGIAASKLLQSGLTHITITAPSLEACAVIFKHIKLELPDAIVHAGKIETTTGCIFFVAPDNLINTKPQTDLLIVDEAAGIPSSNLDILLASYSRIVFASTIHGYEGSGHCFSIKFFKHLDKLTPDWKKIILTFPIRWAADDPLEKLINQVFLLKPLTFTPIEEKNINLDQIEIQTPSQQNLVKNEQLLSSLYDLLSTAHYKTQPSDLANVLNNPTINIFLMLASYDVIGAAFSIKEGGFETDIGDEILLGNRRPKGHIIPQTLAMHLGIKDATRFNYLRIMRIAVQPALQGKGFGSKLIKQLEKFSITLNCDAIGCTFSATKNLINFWSKQDFSLVRLGHHQKSDSNGYAALMLKTTNNNGKQILKPSKQHFEENFPYQLRETHQELEHPIVIAIFQNLHIFKNSTLTEKNRQDLTSYALGNRQFEDNLAAIHRFTLYALSNAATFNHLNNKQLVILILKVLQQKNWQDTVNKLQLTGKKEGFQLLKNTITKLLELHPLKTNL